MLDTEAVFEVLWWDEKPQTAEEIEHVWGTDPPPGITPIPVKAMRIDTPNEEGFFKISLRMTIEDYIRNSTEYDIGAYNILDKIKQATNNDKAILAATHKFMTDPNSDLRIARISADMSADNWPTTPDL